MRKSREFPVRCHESSGSRFCSAKTLTDETNRLERSYPFHLFFLDILRATLLDVSVDVGAVVALVIAIAIAGVAIIVVSSRKKS